MNQPYPQPPLIERIERALVLLAVFVPTTFITGITGQFYRQFAITIAATTAISLLVSLTLSPALCALLLKPHGTGSGKFRLLMVRRDDEFPGRSDKLAWIFALTILAPAGVWMFRSFRLARWPSTPMTTETVTEAEAEAVASEVA